MSFRKKFKLLIILLIQIIITTTFVFPSAPVTTILQKPTLSLKPYYNVTKIVINSKQKYVFIYTDINTCNNNDFEGHDEPKVIKARINAFMAKYKGYKYKYVFDEAVYNKTHKVNAIKGPQTSGVVPKIPHSATGDWKRDSQAFHDYLGFRYARGGTAPANGPSNCNYFSCNKTINNEDYNALDDIHGWYTFLPNTDFTFVIYAWNGATSQGEKLKTNLVVKEILRYYYPKHYEQLYKMLDLTYKAKTEKQAIYFRKIFYTDNRAFFIDYFEKDYLGIYIGKPGKKVTPAQIKIKNYKG